MNNERIARGSVLSIVAELDKRDAEIERLRADLTAMSDSVAVAAQALNDEEREIERLRALLREALPYFGLQTVADGLQVPHPLGVRIRKVLGDD